MNKATNSPSKPFKQTTLSSFMGSNRQPPQQPYQNTTAPPSANAIPPPTNPFSAFPLSAKPSTQSLIPKQQSQQSHLLHLLQQHAPKSPLTSQQNQQQLLRESTISRISRIHESSFEPSSNERKPRSYFEQITTGNHPPYIVSSKDKPSLQILHDNHYNNKDSDDDIVEVTTAPATSSFLQKFNTYRNISKLANDEDDEEEDCVQIINNSANNNINTQNQSKSNRISTPIAPSSTNGMPKQLFPASLKPPLNPQQTQSATNSASATTTSSTHASLPMKSTQSNGGQDFDFNQFRYQSSNNSNNEKQKQQSLSHAGNNGLHPDEFKLSSTSRFQIDPAVLSAERQKRSESMKPSNLHPLIPMFPGANISTVSSSQVVLPSSFTSIVTAESVVAATSAAIDLHSENSNDEDISGDETTKKQRLNNKAGEKRTQQQQPARYQFDCEKIYYDQINEKQARREKLRLKEEEKTARIRQELIEAAQQKEKERAEAERRAQREKLVQIKRADELRKRKKAAAVASNIQSSLQYRNRMKEELRNINVDEKLKENLMTALGSSDINDTTGVHSIAGNMKRNMMDFEFLMAETDEAIDGNNYFALLRFVFSQDYNRADILRIENKRIPNKFSNWKEYFSIFEYLFLMECVASIQQAFTSFKSHENFRSPLGCYVKPVSWKENSHGFLELSVSRRGSDIDEGEIGSAMEDDYYTLTSMRNHAVLLSSTSDMDLSTLSTKPTNASQPFLFFAWVIPPDKADPKSVLKLYVDLDSTTFAAAFEEQKLLFVSIFNFTKMTTFIREYLAIKNMRQSALNRFIYNPTHIAETKAAISNPCNPLLTRSSTQVMLLEILFPLFDELRAKYNHSQFQSIKEICLTSEGICMLQGPPGTGKTHTLLGLLSGLYFYIKKNPESTKPKIMWMKSYRESLNRGCTSPAESQSESMSSESAQSTTCNASIDYFICVYDQYSNFTFQRGPTSPKENVKRASLEYQIEKKLREKGLQQQQSAFPSANGLKNQHEQETLIDMRIDVARVNQEIEKAKKELVGTELKEQLNHLFTKKRNLKAKIAVQKLDKVARRDQIKQVSDQILGLADVVCCTLTSSLSEKLERFKDQIEVLIVDEAAQCSEPNNIIPLFYQPNKIVLIGDPKQLPATTFQPDSNITKYNRSLFERIIDNSIKPYFLDEQYRMHPDIRQFPSSAFYDNKLRDGQYVLTREFPAYLQRMERHNLQFIDITFSRERFSNKSYENDAEAEAAMHICTAVFAGLQRDSESPSIGIITPYKQQTKLINDMIRRTIEKQFWKFIQVNTVDSFQGQEKDIIIFTTVRASRPDDKFRDRMIGFLQDERRMNVALTRARFCLFVLGHADTLNSNLIWGNYVDSMATNKRYGKLVRREELRGIGQYIVSGALISPESLSSVYVKKDWGEEFRLAQQVKEQVNELKLTDFEEEPAPPAVNTTTAMDIEDAPNAEDAENNETNENQASAVLVDGDDDYSQLYYDSIPKRSGVSIQEAIDQAHEEQAMRKFGSGIQGLCSLLSLTSSNHPHESAEPTTSTTTGMAQSSSMNATGATGAANSRIDLASAKQSSQRNHQVIQITDASSMDNFEQIVLEIDSATGTPHASQAQLRKQPSETHPDRDSLIKKSPKTADPNSTAGSGSKPTISSSASSFLLQSEALSPPPNSNHHAGGSGNNGSGSGNGNTSATGASSSASSQIGPIVNSFDIYNQMLQQKKMNIAKKEKKHEKKSTNHTQSSSEAAKSSSQAPSSSSKSPIPSHSTTSSSSSSSSATTAIASSTNSAVARMTSPPRTSHHPSTHSTSEPSPLNQLLGSQPSEKDRDKGKAHKQPRELEKDLSLRDRESQKLKDHLQHQKEKESQKQKELISQQLQQLHTQQQQQQLQKERDKQLAKEKELERAKSKSSNVVYEPLLPNYSPPPKSLAQQSYAFSIPSTPISRSNSNSGSKPALNHTHAGATSSQIIDITTPPQTISKQPYNHSLMKSEPKPFMYSSTLQTNSQNSSAHNSGSKPTQSTKQQLLQCLSIPNDPELLPFDQSPPSSLMSLFSNGAANNHNKHSNNNETNNQIEEEYSLSSLSGLVDSKKQVVEKSSSQFQRRAPSVYDAISQQRSISSSSNQNNKNNSHSNLSSRNNSNGSAKNIPPQAQSNVKFQNSSQQIQQQSTQQLQSKQQSQQQQQQHYQHSFQKDKLHHFNNTTNNTSSNNTNSLRQIGSQNGTMQPKTNLHDKPKSTMTSLTAADSTSSIAKGSQQQQQHRSSSNPLQSLVTQTSSQYLPQSSQQNNKPASGQSQQFQQYQQQQQQHHQDQQQFTQSAAVRQKSSDNSFSGFTYKRKL